MNSAAGQCAPLHRRAPLQTCSQWWSQVQSWPFFQQYMLTGASRLVQRQYAIQCSCNSGRSPLRRCRSVLPRSGANLKKSWEEDGAAPIPQTRMHSKTVSQ